MSITRIQSCGAGLVSLVLMSICGHRFYESIQLWTTTKIRQTLQNLYVGYGLTDCAKTIKIF